MNVKQRIERARSKPFKLTCLEGDYSAYFTSRNDARDAKQKHLNKYEDHKMVITEVVFLED